MNYRCGFCDGKMISQHGEVGTVKCVACGAEHLWNEGMIVSERWVKAEVKRLRGYIETAQRQIDVVDDALPEWKGTGYGRVDTIKVLLAEIERLRRERDVAIHESAHTPSRITYGYSADRDEKGYFVDNVWAGKEYLDAIKIIAVEAKEE